MAEVGRSCFTEAHFCVLPTDTQSNVYGMSHYTTHTTNSKSTCEKVLVACLNGDITLFEYVVSEDNEPKPENNQFRSQYIPRAAEMVSMDSFTKTDPNTGQSMIVLGMTFINHLERGPCGFTIIYTAPLKPGKQFYKSMQVATEKGIPTEMEGIPCQITHAQIFKHGTASTVFLVSTTCKKIHLYKERRTRGPVSTFKESAVGKYFPELDKDIESSIYFMDILYYEENKRRLTCTGSEAGKVTFFMVDVENNTILKTSETMGFGPVTRLVMFSDEPDVPIPHYCRPLYAYNVHVVLLNGDNFINELIVNNYCILALPGCGLKLCKYIYNVIFSGNFNRVEVSHETYGGEDGERREEPVIHVLVCHALEVASVYRDIKKNGLNGQITLKNSYNYDSVLCGCVADVDFDGLNEIILGTFGQRILAYKFDSTAPASEATCLLWEHSLQYPIHSLMPLDLTGDGVKDLAVLSMRGLHILQKDINKAASFISERLTDLQNCFKRLKAKNSSENDKGDSSKENDGLSSHHSLTS